MSQFVERPLFDLVVAWSTSSRVIPKTLKMILLLFGTQHEESSTRNQNWSAHCQYTVTGWNIMSSVSGMIFQ